MSWIRQGTISTTNGSTAVTGVDSLWSIGISPGASLFLVDGNGNPTEGPYEIAAINSNTSLTLAKPFPGTTGSARAYAIANTVGDQTVPDLANDLTQFYGEISELLDQPNTTPVANSIPVADSSGKIATGWLPDATTTTKGAVELATTAEAQAGTDATRAVTPATSGSRTTFSVTSTDDATSATSAPLKSAGGLAVAKDAWIGGDIYQPRTLERVFRTPIDAGTYKITVQTYGGLYDLDVMGHYVEKNRSGFCSYKIHFSARYNGPPLFFLKEIVPPTNNDGSFSEGFSVTLERLDYEGRYAINIMKPDGAFYDIWLRGGALGSGTHYPLTEFIPA